MIEPLSTSLRSALSVVAGLLILGPVTILVFGIGGRSPRTPSPLEILGYEGPIWAVLLSSGLVLAVGVALTLALKRSERES